LYYLGRIGHSQLLPALFEPVYVPEEVVWELDAGRTLHADTINLRQIDWATIVAVPAEEVTKLPPSRLGRGEQAVMAQQFPK